MASSRLILLRCCPSATGLLGSLRKFSISALRERSLGDPDRTLVGPVTPLGARAPPPLAIYRDVVSEAEEARIVIDAERMLRRKAFEDGHFDNVIVGYREAQKPLHSFSDTSQSALTRLVEGIFPAGTQLLPVHLLDLAPTGYIQRHVDHVEYSGAHIVGLSLRTDALMTLHATRESGGPNEDVWLPMRLPRRSLYVLHAEARYEWAHAIPQDPSAWWDAGPLPNKGQRLSVLFRDAPKQQ